jgi:hypothetical protein
MNCTTMLFQLRLISFSNFYVSFKIKIFKRKSHMLCCVNHHHIHLDLTIHHHMYNLFLLSHVAALVFTATAVSSHLFQHSYQFNSNVHTFTAIEGKLTNTSTWQCNETLKFHVGRCDVRPTFTSVKGSYNCQLEPVVCLVTKLKDGHCMVRVGFARRFVMHISIFLILT